MDMSQLPPLTGMGFEQPQAAQEPDLTRKDIVGEIDRKFRLWRSDRQVHEPQWFMNAATFRGNSNVDWNSYNNQLVAMPEYRPQKSRRRVNRVFAKIRARRAKFLKNRPTWIVVPATTDVKDKMDARATGKVLEYIWRKLHLEKKYRDAIIWAEQCSKGFWWFGFNEDTIGRVKLKDEFGKEQIVEAVIGEVTVEVGSPFEIFVGDPSSSSLDTQLEIIRAKERTLEYIKGRWPEAGEQVQPEGGFDTFQYEAQIASLNSTNGLFGGSDFSSTTRKTDSTGAPNTAIVKEYFMRPTHEFPKGKYCVVANGILLDERQELPFGFWEFDNPFPCVEFSDLPTVGQFWGTTVLEQLIDLQKEYNDIRTMISRQIKIMGHPKLLVAKQHQLAPGAWTPDAGEIVEFNARPGISDPKPWLPPNIVSDAWRAIELLKTEFDDIAHIYPSSEGSSKGAESGFHANLLQEASDVVHGPDIRGHELAVEEAAYKIRKIVKKFYQIPRIIAVTTGSYEPDIFEFAGEDVDDHADIIVQAGSALPALKGARIQAALDLYSKGVLGDPVDPEVRRRLLNVLDLGGMDDIYEFARVDEDMINVENTQAEDGVELAAPRFFENHQKHYDGHIAKLKSPAVMQWQPEIRMELLRHAILHVKYVNHAAAYQMAIEAGFTDLIPAPPPMPMLPPGMGDPAQARSPSPQASFNGMPDQTPASGTPDARGA